MNDTKEIRVAIFEDNPIMMDAYRSILNGSPGYKCTGSFSSCNNWKHDIQKSEPDVVLMDIEMTGLNVETDVILEIASVITDGNLEVIVQGPSFIINQPEEKLLVMDKWCTSHHKKSGNVDVAKFTNNQ